MSTEQISRKGPSPRGVDGLHHLAIKSKRPAKLAEFYRDILGLEETTRNVDDAGLRSIWLRLGEAILMIERSESGGEIADFAVDPPGMHLLAYRIIAGDRAAWVSKLESNGCRLKAQSLYSLYFTDPEGHRFALSHWPEPFNESQENV